MGKAEAFVEGYLVKRAHENSIVCRKLAWVNRRNGPDRYLAKNGRQCFVECKSELLSPTTGQSQELVALRSEGVVALCVNSRAGVDKVIEWLAGTGPMPRIMKDIVV